MVEQNQTPKFPKTFSKCPVCGSEDTFTGLVKADEVAERRMNPLVKTGFQMALPVVDPTRIVAQITAPVLLALFDVCADCGTYDCREANVVRGMVGPGPQKLGPQPGQFLHGNPH